MTSLFRGFNYIDILMDTNINYKESFIVEKIFSWHHAMFEKSNQES